MILNLSSFIHSLLIENETVIIPGFGAFISTYKPAEIGDNEIKPPSKEISFNSKIKNNDGLLAEIIARKAKISQTNALKRIEKARENMLFELDKGNTVKLENIGEISYNTKNELVFTPFKNNNLLIDSFGFEPVLKEENISENIIDNTEEQEDSTIAGATVLGNVEKPEDEEKNSQETKEEEVEKEPSAENFRLPEFQAAPVVEEKEEENKKFAWYWYLLILIPLLIGVYYVIMKQSQSNKTEISQTKPAVVQKEITPEQEENPKDTAKIDSSIVAKQAPTEAKTNEGLNTDFQGESGKYYLIRGGFEEEENVKEFMQELKAEGVESFVVGKTGRLILVGIEEFETEKEAKNALNQYFISKPDWKLWVYKVK